MTSARYAIYFVPERTSALYRFGASVLGYDSYSGQPCHFIDDADDTAWPAVVREPRLYGFHATLKAPFHLAESVNEDAMVRKFKQFSADQAAVLIGALAVREIGSFVALVPNSPRPLLDRLAQACVREFDRFRAPMSEQEYTRRLVPGLSERQTENLARWGYPHVFDDFRFHMTLTGSLPMAKRTKALQFLCAKYEQLPGVASVVLDQIVIARQQEPRSPFEIFSNALLGRSPDRPYAYTH
jgi:putative phosphonate metabolism protein